MLKHFLVIRLGLGVYHLPWYESRLDLFEAVTCPSLRAQSNQAFFVLIVIDRQMPAPALNRLREIIADAQNFRIVPLDITGLRQVRHGCQDFVWDRCQDYIIELGLLTDPFEYVITSILDDDDAWHRSTVETVCRILEPEVPRVIAEEGKRTYHRHTSGQVLTFPRGLKWFAHADVVQPYESEFLGTSVFVLARFSGGISALSSRHPSWQAMAHIAVFDVTKAEADRPMWVYVRHDRSQVTWQVEPSASDPVCEQALRSDFGIDFTKIQAWRTKRALPRTDTGQNYHAGLSGSKQLDCYYRIAALNRQIAVLEAKRQREGLSDDAELLVRKQEGERLQLLEQLQRQGHQLFEVSS